MDECKSLLWGIKRDEALEEGGTKDVSYLDNMGWSKEEERGPVGRGLHSSTFLLNLSPFRHDVHPEHSLVTPNTS